MSTQRSGGSICSILYIYRKKKEEIWLIWLEMLEMRLNNASKSVRAEQALLIKFKSTDAPTDGK